MAIVKPFVCIRPVEALAAQVAARGWSPTFICESAGTQAEDALEMKRIYEACR